MIKITGNEAVHPINWTDGYGGVYQGRDSGGRDLFSSDPGGIPIRLYLAAAFASHQNSIILTPQDAAYLLQKADALIAAYNSTPNPNAQQNG